MAQIIPLNRLAELLATRVGISDAEAQRFIQLYFETISYGLVSGGDVSIKGLGTFTRSSDPDSVVTFTPDDSLAKTLNAPFEAFVPVSIPGDFDIHNGDFENITVHEPDRRNPQQNVHNAELNSADNGFDDNQQVASKDTDIADSDSREDQPTDNVVHANETQVPVNPEHTASVQNEDTEKHQDSVYSASKDEDTSETCANVPVTDLNTNEDGSSAAGADDYDDNDEEHAEVYILPRRKCRPMLWGMLGLLVGAMIGIIIGYYFHNDIDRYIGVKPDVVVSKHSTIKLKPKSLAPLNDKRNDSCASDTPKVAIERTKPEPRYDVVTSHQFLTTLAKKYYGVKDYWVYIYEANKSRLRHPDRIKPGTRIMIPEITEYLADPTPTEANILHAKNLAIQIYGRFSK